MWEKHMMHHVGDVIAQPKDLTSPQNHLKNSIFGAVNSAPRRRRNDTLRTASRDDRGGSGEG